MNAARSLVTQDVEEAEVLNACFILVFIRKTDIQESQALEVKEKGWSKEDLSLMEPNQVGVSKQTGNT